LPIESIRRIWSRGLARMAVKRRTTPAVPRLKRRRSRTGKAGGEVHGVVEAAKDPGVKVLIVWMILVRGAAKVSTPQPTASRYARSRVRCRNLSSCKSRALCPIWSKINAPKISEVKTKGRRSETNFNLPQTSRCKLKRVRKCRHCRREEI